MKKLILLFCFFAFQSKAKIKKPSAYDAYTLKFAMSGIADPINPCVQFGIEFKPVWNIGLQLEAANSFGLNYVQKNKYNLNYQKYKMRAVWYYYEKVKLNMYAGLDFLYLPKSYEVRNGNYANDQYYFLESANVNKRTVGIFLIDGITLKRTKHLRFDFAVNIGIRMTQIHYSEFKGIKPAQAPKDYIFYNPQDNVEGMHYYPHMGIGVRLGYVLQTKKVLD